MKPVGEELRLLHAMGWETANIDLGSQSARKLILRHLDKQKAKWLQQAAADMLKSVREDWRTWRKEGYVSIIYATSSHPGSSGHADHWLSQRSQCHSAIALINKCPLRGALVAQPVVLYLPLLLPSANEWRNSGLSRFGRTIGFNQKQFALSLFRNGFEHSGLAHWLSMTFLHLRKGILRNDAAYAQHANGHFKVDSPYLPLGESQSVRSV